MGVTQAAVGLIAWTTWLRLDDPAWTAALLALSPLVLVPHGLGLAHRTLQLSAWFTTLRRGATPAAIAVAASLALPSGRAAAVLTLPWLVIASVAALAALIRFAGRRSLDPWVGVEAGLGFLAVGAGWLTISRAGLNPLGFDDLIVQLTAVHFHYAGFALPLVAGLVSGERRRGPALPLWIVAGVPLTALGIVAGGTLEWIAATVMATGGLAVACRLLATAVHRRSVAGGLLVIAGSSLAAGMLLALGWAWSRQFGWEYLDLAGMARWHGSLNALGFGFVALAAFSFVADTTAPPSTLHLGRPDGRAVASTPTDPTTPTPSAAALRSTRRSILVSGELDDARAAIGGWMIHRRSAAVFAELPSPPHVGQVLRFALPLPWTAGALWTSVACEVVDVIDEPSRVGFTYRALGHHHEEGVESFEFRAEGDTTTLELSATWRPVSPIARLGGPITRMVQRRATDRYLERCTLGSIADPPPPRRRDRARHDTFADPSLAPAALLAVGGTGLSVLCVAAFPYLTPAGLMGLLVFGPGGRAVLQQRPPRLERTRLALAALATLALTSGLIHGTFTGSVNGASDDDRNLGDVAGALFWLVIFVAVWAYATYALVRLARPGDRLPRRSLGTATS